MDIKAKDGLIFFYGFHFEANSSLLFLESATIPEWFRDQVKPYEKATETRHENHHSIIKRHRIVHHGHDSEHEEGETTETASHKKRMFECHRFFGFRAQK